MSEYINMSGKISELEELFIYTLGAKVKNIKREVVKRLEEDLFPIELVLNVDQL